MKRGDMNCTVRGHQRLPRAFNRCHYITTDVRCGSLSFLGWQQGREQRPFPTSLGRPAGLSSDATIYPTITILLWVYITRTEKGEREKETQRLRFQMEIGVWSSSHIGGFLGYSVTEICWGNLFRTSTSNSFGWFDTLHTVNTTNINLNINLKHCNWRSKLGRGLPITLL